MGSPRSPGLPPKKADNGFFLTEPKPGAPKITLVDNEGESKEIDGAAEEPAEIDANASKAEDDEFNIMSEGEQVDPLSLVDPSFVDVARLEAGASFGELALIDGKPRMCTVKCLSRSHFIVLSKADYKKSLFEIEKKRQAEKSNFIKNIPFFSKLTRTFLNKLSYNFKTLYMTKDAFLYRQGDLADKVFIVRKGKFVVTQNLTCKNRQSENIQEILKDP